MVRKKLGNTWFMHPKNARTNEMIAKFLLLDGFSEESHNVNVQCLDRYGHMVVKDLWCVPVEYFQRFITDKQEFPFIDYDCYKKSSDNALPRETSFMSSNRKLKKRKGKKIRKVKKDIQVLQNNKNAQESRYSVHRTPYGFLKGRK